MAKSFVVLSLMALGVLGSWTGPMATPGPEAVDVRPEALGTGFALLILAAVLRMGTGGGRVS